MLCVSLVQNIYIVLLPAELLPAVRDVAAVVVRVDLARVETAVMVCSANVERTTVTGLPRHHRPLRNVVLGVKLKYYRDNIIVQLTPEVLTHFPPLL